MFYMDIQLMSSDRVYYAIKIERGIFSECCINLFIIYMYALIV